MLDPLLILDVVITADLLFLIHQQTLQSQVRGRMATALLSHRKMKKRKKRKKRTVQKRRERTMRWNSKM